MYKILVIEDDAIVRANLKEFLLEEGYQVFSAENGVTGINIAKTYLPDLIISDIMMPRKDGYDVLSELSKDDLTARIPFIFLTAKAESAEKKAGLKLGADDYLTKPFTAEELFKAVKLRLKKDPFNSL